MMKVYLFEWNECVYESDYSVESIHLTKAGAYKAMRKALMARWYEGRGVNPTKFDRRFKILDSSAWRVREVELKE